MTPTERMPRIEAIRHALSDTRLEGLTIHPNDRAVLDAWARHELDLPQAIDRLHQLLDAQASILTPDERQSRALASFPTLRLAELQCYGLVSDPPPISPPRLAVTFPPLTPAERRVYTQEEISADYDGYLLAIPLDYSQAQIDQLPDDYFRSTTQRVVRMPPSDFKRQSS
jgi:hypothetical protein